MDRVLRFWRELAAVHETKPDWSLPNRELYANCSFALRAFREGEGAPILIIPPNAGHHSCITEKLITTLMGVVPAGPIYSLDWLPAQSCNESCGDTLDALNSYVGHCVNMIGKPVHLVGLCQGGWLGTVFTALHHEKVRSLVLAAAPIDFSAAGPGESKMEFWVNRLPMSYFEGMVNCGDGVQMGDMQLFGFKALNAYDRYFGDYVELWSAIVDRDEKAIARWRRNHVWYDNPQSLGGKWYLEAVDKLFKRNLLIKNELEISGQKVDLSNIHCPLYMLAGGDDDITHQKEMFALGEHVSSSTIVKYVIPECGHIGVFVRDVALEYWKKIAASAYCSDPAEDLMQKLKL